MVNHGDTISLGVKEVFSDLTYYWSIPYFANTPTGAYYQSGYVRSFQRGWYKVVANGDNGVHLEDSVFVEIIPLSVPCNPTDNKLTSNLVTMNLSPASGSTGSYGYKLTASSSNGDVYIDFGLDVKPYYEGTFITASSPQYDDEVKISLVANSVAFTGKINQQVHIKMENGKPTVTLCDFDMGSSVGSDIIVDAKIIKN